MEAQNTEEAGSMVPLIERSGKAAYTLQPGTFSSGDAPFLKNKSPYKFLKM